MLNELDWKILKHMLACDTPVSNKELSLACNAAVNTIRKELGVINKTVRQHGFQIISKASVGNYLKIDDAALAEPYIEWLYERCNRKQRIGNRYPPQVLYLVRRCLSSSGQITAEQLCQELYCSMGTLQRDFRAVREILRAYELTLKNSRSVREGLIVEGEEWDIRQCLIYQHKLFQNCMEETNHRESVFRSLFFMLGNRDYYDEARIELMGCLAGQQDITVPVLCFPKLIHYMQLSVSRGRFSINLRFAGHQAERARNTVEYTLAEELYARMQQRFGWTVSPQDVLGLAMLILSYESRNCHLRELPEYLQLREETQELVVRLSEFWGYSREIFDEVFVEDWILFLYTLKNRLLFRVYSDDEIFGYIKTQRIGTSDICLLFARFYKEKHGVALGKENVLGAFYLFHRMQRALPYCYYAQNILVVSQYGISCAKSLALNIRRGYGKEVNSVTPVEICECMGEEATEADLLMTDLSMNSRKYLINYHLPVLTVEFAPEKYHHPELDDYLKKLQESCERTIVKDYCFRRVDLRSRDAVLEYLAEQFNPLGIERTVLVRHLQENDSYVGLEREHGVVLLPVLLLGRQQELVVLLNRHVIVWNKQHARIFVCYNRLSSLKANQMLNGILRRFVHISPETAAELLMNGSEPLKLLYSERR